MSFVDGKMAHHVFNIPRTKEVSSICNKSQFLFVDFGPDIYGSGQTEENDSPQKDCTNCMIMQFDKKNKTIGLSLIMFNLALTTKNFPDIKGSQHFHFYFH